MGDIRTPDGQEITDDGGIIGLALSGSGLKAALFHIGTLARLAELDLLRRIDVISASGGGALVAALYHLHLKQALDAEGDIDSQRLIELVKAVERDLLAAAQTDLRAQLYANPFVNLKRLSPHFSSAARLGDLLDRQVFRPVRKAGHDLPVELRDLAIRPRGDEGFNPITDNRQRYCKAPWLVINAANLATGRAWRFDAERMGEPAAGPAARRLSKVPLLAQSPYRRLPDAYAGMTLGRAVAAALATPGLIEPLHLPNLYPDPERPARCLDVRLGDGRLADALGTDALLERGCNRLIVSDASGVDMPTAGPSDRMQALQLAALEASRPGGVVLVHMLREIEAVEVKPVGPIGRGRVVEDRHDDDVTSYGVEARLQKLIAAMRADLDAPSEIEAMSLMADGYLIARRAFQRHRQSGLAWSDDPPLPPVAWRFTAVIDALGKPSKTLVKNLKTGRFLAFKAPRLAWSEAFTLGLLAVTGALTFVALGALWSALRPAAGGDSLWLAATIGLLSAMAWLAGRHRGARRTPNQRPAWATAILRGIDGLGTLTLALPLAIGARFERRASRAFLKAGRLIAIGIQPIKPEASARSAPARAEPAAPPRQQQAA
ncbi:MAG: patatin-like phospholipase family protein [Alphaproteobacteria bacterium]